MEELNETIIEKSINKKIIKRKKGYEDKPIIEYWTINKQYPYVLEHYNDPYYNADSISYLSTTDKDEAYIFHYQSLIEYYTLNIHWINSNDPILDYETVTKKYTDLLKPYRKTHPEEFI